MSHFIKLNDAGTTLPDSATDHSVLVLPDAGLMFDVRALHRGDHASCVEYAMHSALLGHSWRMPTVLELFTHVSDRTCQAPARDPDRFPKLSNDWVWSGDPDAGDDPSSPVYAWGVALRRGDAYIGNRGYGGLALPVAAWAAPASQ